MYLLDDLNRCEDVYEASVQIFRLLSANCKGVMWAVSAGKFWHGLFLLNTLFAVVAKRVSVRFSPSPYRLQGIRQTCMPVGSDTNCNPRADRGEVRLEIRSALVLPRYCRNLIIVLVCDEKKVPYAPIFHIIIRYGFCLALSYAYSS